MPAMTIKPPPPKSLADALRSIENVSAFAKASGIPRRTINRIRATPDHPMSATTRIALEAALKKHKPKSRA